jgi:hypothetical protein
MSMNTADFLIMTEEYTWTFELFIGALGGAIGIWLGLDFGVLIEIVFKPIMMLLRKLLSRKGASDMCHFDPFFVSVEQALAFRLFCLRFGEK